MKQKQFSKAFQPIINDIKFIRQVEKFNKNNFEIYLHKGAYSLGHQQLLKWMSEWNVHLVSRGESMGGANGWQCPSLTNEIDLTSLWHCPLPFWILLSKSSPTPSNFYTKF